MKTYPLINSKLSIIDLLYKLDTGNQYAFEGKIYCPFHYNTFSPAAKLYRNEDGDYLYCYAEAKMYRPVDVLKLLNYNLDVVEQKLQDKFGPAAKVTRQFTNKNVKTDLFKTRQISLMDYCLYIKNNQNENGGSFK